MLKAALAFHQGRFTTDLCALLPLLSPQPAAAVAQSPLHRGPEAEGTAPGSRGEAPRGGSSRNYQERLLFQGFSSTIDP